MATAEHLKSRDTFSDRHILAARHLDDKVKPGTLRYGLWQAPDIDMTDYDRHVVVDSDLMRIDAIAYKWYEDVSLWWAICLVNNVANAFEDLYVGQILLIPKLAAITDALAKITRE